MNCLETQKRIHLFLNNELPDQELGQFLEHIESCDDCREELGIYVALDTALTDSASLREGLSKEQDSEEKTRNLIRTAQKHLRAMKIRKSMIIFFVSVFVLIMVYLAFNVVDLGKRHDPLAPAGTETEAPAETESAEETEVGTETEAAVETEAGSETVKAETDAGTGTAKSETKAGTEAAKTEAERPK